MQLSRGVTICSSQSVEHPFLVNHLAGLWENLVLGACEDSGSWVLGWLSLRWLWCSHLTGHSSAGPSEAAGL